mgnify:CR=1 FL=1
MTLGLANVSRMPGRNWDRIELLKALALYCQLPFGKMHARNPVVIALAVDIDRTPSSVALKLVNFASLDPEHRRRGVRGMRNASSADKEIWHEYYGRWDALAEWVLEPQTGEWSSDDVAKLAVPDGPTEVLRETKARRGQQFFCNAVFAAHGGQCCITGITSLELLRASHIVPWSFAPESRLDPRNGLCLNALHDAAFDHGMITLTDDLRLTISSRLRNKVPEAIFVELFESRAGHPIRQSERFRPASESLAYHREQIFVS